MKTFRWCSCARIQQLVHSEFGPEVSISQTLGSTYHGVLNQHRNDRDGQLTRDEWAVAMHLVVCTTGRHLPLPARLPRCLRIPPKAQQLPPSGGKKAANADKTQKAKPPPGEEEASLKAPGLKRGGKSKTSVPVLVKGAAGGSRESSNHPPVDLKQATKEFRNGEIKAEEFLLVLQVCCHLRPVWYIHAVELDRDIATMCTSSRKQ